MKNQFTKAMQYRHACKQFNNVKKISNDNINYILEVGRTSPSSFGMEPWKFLVITNQQLKEQLKPLCWDQIQITSCSHLVIILAKINTLKPSSGIPQKRFARRPLSKEKIDAYIELYSNHLKDTLSNDGNIYSWTSKQTYLAAANMMTAAAFIDIDSCPIEGFEKDKVEQLLNLDVKEYQVSLIVPFGYRLNEQSKQLRLDFDDVVEFIS